MQLLGDLKDFLIHSVPHGNVAASIASFDILESIMWMQKHTYKMTLLELDLLSKTEVNWVHL